jgi:ATPase subunit of ABC transporter with duplicated ATPase domains
MDFPDIDRGLIVAANEKYETFNTTLQKTQAALPAAEAALAAVQQHRKDLVAQTARGETVLTQQHREAEELVRDAERQVLHLREIAEIQEQARLAADAERRKAHALAHRPRIIHALRELADCSQKYQAAQTILAGVSRRDHEARVALSDAWGAGHPIPQPLRPPGGYAMTPIPSMATARALRTLFGDLAEEAFGPAATPATPAAP